ncbi:MAG: DUF4390 domain-containing protein [Gammaproteobacteria bacterium]
MNNPWPAVAVRPGWVWMRPLFVLLMLVGSLSMPTLSAAAEGAETKKAADASIVIREVGARQDGHALIVQPELTLSLTDAATEAVISGIPITLAIDSRLMRARAYMWDELVASSEDYIQISYHALSRRFLLHQTQSNSHRIFRHLDQVLASLATPESLRLALDEPLDPEERYYGTLRISLDVSQLPRPLQLPAYLTSDWRLDSGTSVWSITP